ncbi:MAG: hypothetical protein ACPGYV_10050 [Phycisphaeraceae bacterium]
MTQRQRKAHVLMWLVLVPAALAGLALAVLWRPAEPVQVGDLPGVTDRAESDDEDGGSR